MKSKIQSLLQGFSKPCKLIKTLLPGYKKPQIVLIQEQLPGFKSNNK